MRTFSIPRSICWLAVGCAAGITFAAADPPPQLARWWAHTRYLASDALQGRDTGSAGYQKAADYVAEDFRRAGLQPAGDDGTYFQRVPMHSIALDKKSSSIAIVRNGSVIQIPLLQQITLVPRSGMPEKMQAPIVFAGYAATGAAVRPDVCRGKFVLYLNTAPPNTPRDQFAKIAADRARLIIQSGAVGAIAIDYPRATEMRTWPAAYARSVTLAGPTPPRNNTPIYLRLSPQAVDSLLKGTGHSFATLMALDAAAKPLPVFPTGAQLRLRLRLRASDISSDNVLAVLPGSDPVLRNEYVVVSAHLDGYGFGEPVNGDKIYNGAFDDAAYVATLMDYAEHLHRAGKAPRRSILFAAFTGEEKGLLGSTYFTLHPTEPNSQLVADVNLDMLRPIFPLTILTTLGLDQSSLGQTVQQVASEFNIRIQPDKEPERGLFRRSDHYSFFRIGVPAVGFIFGYEPGSTAENIYRNWYAKHYHRPADDTNQPIDFAAALKFNQFFERLSTTIANAPSRPTWNSESPYAPGSKETKLLTESTMRAENKNGRRSPNMMGHASDCSFLALVH